MEKKTGTKPRENKHKWLMVCITIKINKVNKCQSYLQRQRSGTFLQMWHHSLFQTHTIIHSVKCPAYMLELSILVHIFLLLLITFCFSFFLVVSESPFVTADYHSNYVVLLSVQTFVRNLTRCRDMPIHFYIATVLMVLKRHFSIQMNIEFQ